MQSFGVLDHGQHKLLNKQWGGGGGVDGGGDGGRGGVVGDLCRHNAHMTSHWLFIE